MITQQILVAFGPNLCHGCISGVLFVIQICYTCYMLYMLFVIHVICYTGCRSRSAPARSTSVSPVSSCVQSPESCRRGPVLPSSRAWVDTRRCSDVTEPLELKVYNEEHLEKMARRRREAQVKSNLGIKIEYFKKNYGKKGNDMK